METDLYPRCKTAEATRLAKHNYSCGIGQHVNYSCRIGQHAGLFNKFKISVTSAKAISPVFIFKGLSDQQRKSSLTIVLSTGNTPIENKLPLTCLLEEYIR